MRIHVATRRDVPKLKRDAGVIREDLILFVFYEPVESLQANSESPNTHMQS